MSTSPIELPLLIAQLPHVQKLANAEQVNPEVQRSLFAPLIAKHVREDDNTKVGKVDKKDEAQAVDRDGSHGGGGQSGRKRSGKDHDEETNASDPSPWSGNIVDMKV